MISTPKTFLLGEDRLTAGIALAMARGKTQGKLSKSTRKKVGISRSVVESIVDKGHPVPDLAPCALQKFPRPKLKYYRPIFYKAIVLVWGHP